MKPNKYVLIIIFLLLSLVASLILVLRTTVFIGKAATDNKNAVALENSYLFASPIQAKADSREQIRVTVYLLDGRGIGVPNQKVTLAVPSTVHVNDVQSLSDDAGKAVFDLSTVTPGKITVSAQAENKELSQKVKIVFY